MLVFISFWLVCLFVRFAVWCVGVLDPMVLSWCLSGDCWWLLGGAVHLVSGF